MPVYIYEHIGKHGRCPVEFEHYQKITDDSLEKCPVCGQPIRRIIREVNITTDKLSPSRLNELGMRKFVRKDKGVYEAENKRPDEAHHKVIIDKSRQK